MNIDGTEVVSYGSLNIIKKIITAELNKGRYSRDVTEAAAQTHYEKIKFFLKHSTDINSTYLSREEIDKRLNWGKGQSGERIIIRHCSKNEEQFTSLLNLIAHELGSADEIP